MESCSSSSFPPRSDYQVFLSFRGEDTRKTFISHLYNALDRCGIRAFKDDKTLDKGESISPELHRAIERSRIAIVVFSKNYASSSWCLEELVRIAESKKRNAGKVMPVFYEVDPSDVRKQRGNFEEAFAEHKETFEEDQIRRWKEALAIVSEHGGWDSRKWNDEAGLVDDIVKYVSDRLFPMSQSDNSYLVGMDGHMEELDHWLCKESMDVRLIGLWGMGGVGKTTIARCFYDRVRKHFQHFCFIENVKEMCRNHEHRIVKLQEEFLSQIFRERGLKLWDAGSTVIKERLCNKRVLVILDDVDELDQLNIFAGDLEWFGPGSRIIITTRDRRLLEIHKVKHVYKVELLKKTEALQLFVKYAFEQNHPEEDFHQLSTQVIKYAGGLPLALKVLGSLLLRKRAKSEWEETLSKLSTTPITDITKVLRISYDKLDKEEKDIFLFIACRLNRMAKKDIRAILNCCGLKTDLGIKSLVEKSLITCNEWKGKMHNLYHDLTWVRVHDILQDMARDIIREDGPTEPWKHKILWKSDDIEELFAVSNQCNEMIRVEGIFANMSEAIKLNLTPTVFNQMYNLKLLEVRNNYHAGENKLGLPEGLDCLPRKLAYLFWDSFPLQSLPSGFYPENLVELHLPNSFIEKLWDGTQPLRNLRVINLSKCLKLIEVPDLSKATRLESLNLSYCENLNKVSSSVGNLRNLHELKLINCRKLKKLPDGINLKSLTRFSPLGCSGLSAFPCLSENLEILSLCGTAIEEVPPSIQHLSRLGFLKMSQSKKLRNLPSELQNLESLQTLDLSCCPNITEFPQVGKNIKQLFLRTTAIKKVPSWIESRRGLEVLNMSHCKRIVNLPDSIRSLTALQELNLKGCSNITKFPKIPQNLRFLSLLGSGIRGLDSIHRRGDYLVINGEYDTNGRWIPPKFIKLSHRCLVLPILMTLPTLF